MHSDVETLRIEILSRSKSLYAFCRDYKLPHGTIYQIMRGRYAGDCDAQIARIRKALDTENTATRPDEEAVIATISNVACKQCTYGKRRCRKIRRQCIVLWKTQAAAVRALWEAGNEQDY